MAKQDRWRIVQAGAIDPLLWDRCVASDPAAKVYNYYDYLNTFARSWKGAVYGDYVACFPLTGFRKGHLPWLMKPAATQQLQLAVLDGINPGAEVIEGLRELILRHYKVIQVAVSPPVDLGPVTRVRTNYCLDLSPEYPFLRSGFTKSGLRNIKKAEAAGLSLEETGDIAIVIDLYQAAYGALAQLKTYVYEAFRKLAGQQYRHFRARTYVVKEESGAIVFAALLLEDHKALYYVLGAPTEKGRSLRATYYFIGELIRQNAGKPVKLDFEGSDIKNVADFYLSFGPQEEKYHFYQLNRYAQPLKWVLQKVLGF